MLWSLLKALGSGLLCARVAFGECEYAGFEGSDMGVYMVANGICSGSYGSFHESGALL